MILPEVNSRVVKGRKTKMNPADYITTIREMAISYKRIDWLILAVSAYYNWPNGKWNVN